MASKIPSLQKEYSIYKTINGKRESIAYKKYELITNHTRRRTFATNAILKGISTSVVMAITGHKTEKYFNKYLKMGKKEPTIVFAIEMKS